MWSWRVERHEFVRGTYQCHEQRMYTMRLKARKQLPFEVKVHSVENQIKSCLVCSYSGLFEVNFES